MFRIRNAVTLAWNKKAVLFDEEAQPVPMTVGNEEFALRGKGRHVEFL
ncbi:MAG: hypothetical protein J7L95_01330 [Prolixibacteraceae bacterium]|nr:hypothetical protein [Prolixibacteraceae bacterium]